MCEAGDLIRAHRAGQGWCALDQGGSGMRKVRAMWGWCGPDPGTQGWVGLVWAQSRHAGLGGCSVRPDPSMQSKAEAVQDLIRMFWAS